MAVEIISEGDLDNLPTYTKTCPECGCEFTYQYKDCKWVSIDSGFTGINCPTCGYLLMHVWNENRNNPNGSNI